MHDRYSLELQKPYNLLPLATDQSYSAAGEGEMMMSPPPRLPASPFVIVEEYLSYYYLWLCCIIDSYTRDINDTILLKFLLIKSSC